MRYRLLRNSLLEALKVLEILEIPNKNGAVKVLANNGVRDYLVFDVNCEVLNYLLLVYLYNRQLNT